MPTRPVNTQPNSSKASANPTDEEVEGQRKPNKRPRLTKEDTTSIPVIDRPNSPDQRQEKQSSVVSPTLESPSQDPPASRDNSTTPTFCPFAAPLSPCLIPSALVKEGSQALDLSRPIHEDIRNGCYGCLICKGKVGPVSRIWSCQTCSYVLHLSCVERLVRAELSPEKLNASDVLEGWHCPSCNLAQLE